MEASVQSSSTFDNRPLEQDGRNFFFFFQIPRFFWMSESLGNNLNTEPMRAMKRFSCMKSHKKLHIFIKYIAIC